LVNLVEEWEIVKDYAGDKQGFYQILGNDDAVEIRVAVGRLGFKKEFESKKDPSLSNILAFCKFRKYIKVSESIRDENFFK
jgi:hypothetical protein